MQITVKNEESGNVHTLTLRLVIVEDDADNCPLCSNVPPVWTVDPATPEAMDPQASAIGASACCAGCLNHLIATGDVEIAEIDPDTF